MDALQILTDPRAAAAGQLLAAGTLALAGEDVLRVIAFNAAPGVTVTCTGRHMQLDGTITAFRVDLAPTSDRALSVAHYHIGAGWLLNVQAYASAGTPKRGQCFVGVELSRGQTGAREPLATLAKDYVSEGQGIAWPGSPIRSSVEGPGCMRVVSGTNPAAGAEVSETVPTGARWRIAAIALSLATDATVANRTPAIILDDGTTTFYRAGVAAAQTASQSVQYHATAAFGTPTGTGGYHLFNIPEPTILRAGWRVRTSTGALQAGDDYGAPALHVEEWIEP